MKLRNISLILVLSLALLITISSVYALTAKIGNARAIVNGETGDTLERTIKVINDNNVSVLIELFASGNLSEDIKILDNNFTLAPGESKNARYEVYLREVGSTENHINVKFTAVGEKQGVGMTSTLIINVKEGPGFLENLFNGEDNNDDSSNLNDPTNSNDSEKTGSGTSTGVLLIIVLVLVLIVLIAIFFYLKKRAEYLNSKKGLKTKQKKKVRAK